MAPNVMVKMEKTTTSTIPNPKKLPSKIRVGSIEGLVVDKPSVFGWLISPVHETIFTGTPQDGRLSQLWRPVW